MPVKQRFHRLETRVSGKGLSLIEWAFSFCSNCLMCGHMQAPWITSPSFVISPWSIAAPIETKPIPEYQTDENLKKAYGIELAKSTNPLDAAFKLAGDDNSKALWISFHWLHDP